MKNVVVVGCGGVGSWAAYCVAMRAQQDGEACTLTLIDGDAIETKNITRMAWVGGDGAAGMYKVEQIRNVIARTVPNVTIVVRARHFLPETDVLYLTDADTIICATDTVSTQRWLHTYCKQTSKRYIRAGYDGDEINVTTQFALTLEDDATEQADAGYHSIPTIFPAIVAGALAAYKVFNEDGPMVLGPLGRLGVKDSELVPERVVDALVEKNGWHTEDECEHPDCERQHCEDGNCEIPDGYHNYDDCDHSECIHANIEDAADYIERQHGRSGHRSRNCPFCTIDELTTRIEELEANVTTTETEETHAPLPTETE